MGLISHSAAGSSGIAPVLTHDAIRRRDALWEKLGRGLGCRLVVVQAGCGKTTFLASFALAEPGSLGAPIAWQTLGHPHHDRIHLLQDLARPLQAGQPRLGGVTPAALARLERGGCFVATVGTGAERSHRHNPVFRGSPPRELAESLPADRARSPHLRLAQSCSRMQQWDAAVHHLLEAAEYRRASELVALDQRRPRRPLQGRHRHAAGEGRRG